MESYSRVCWGKTCQEDIKVGGETVHGTCPKIQILTESLYRNPRHTCGEASQDSLY